MDDLARLSSVANKREELGTAKPKLSLHRRPPASADRIDTVEQRYKVRLPPDCRAFVMTIADGGPAPDDEALLPVEEAFEGAEEALDAACPLVEDSDYRQTWQHDKHAFRGVLPIAEPEIRVSREPPRFFAGMGFLPWYERWLDAELGRPSPAPSEESFLATDPERLHEPELVRRLEGLRQAADLSARSLPFVRACLADGRKRVMAQARPCMETLLIRRLGLAHDSRFESILSADPMQREDLFALAVQENGNVTFQRSLAAVLSRETDPQRFLAIAAALVPSRELTAEVLEPATGSENVELRREAAFARSTVAPPRDASMFTQLLSDPDERVRMHAECALQRWRSLRELPDGDAPYRR